MSKDIDKNVDGIGVQLGALRVVCAALWLRGAPRRFQVPWRRRQAVLAALRRYPGTCPSGVLSSSGFYEEALLLLDDRLVRWAQSKVAKGLVLTIEDPEYPAQWRRQLVDTAPPALWRLSAKPNEVPERRSCPRLAVVGSRQVCRATLSMASAVGRWAAEEGLGVLSGGAEGCDHAAMKAAMRTRTIAPVWALLPFGIHSGFGSQAHTNRIPVHSYATDAFALCAPDEPFTTAAAMERNRLIYAGASLSVVVHARLKQGGTWHGATTALRRHEACIAVWRSPCNPAWEVLARLGAHPFQNPEDLAPLLACPCIPRGGSALPGFEAAQGALGKYT